MLIYLLIFGAVRLLIILVYGSYLTRSMSLMVCFYMPPELILGHLVFVLSVTVCLSVSDDSVAKNFNLGHNFWIVKDRDFIFGMHIQLVKPFQMTPRSMTEKSQFWTLLPPGAFIFHKHTRFIFNMRELLFFLS